MKASRTCAVALVAVLALGALVAQECRAQCCGTAYSAYYQPTAHQAYYQPVAQPVAATTYQTTTGWYPGWLLDRIRMRLWGATTTQTVSYAPTAYSAGYAPATYSAGYAPVYQTVARPVTLAAYQPACGCTTCGCDPCSCANHTTSYQPSACSTCGTSYSSGYTTSGSTCATCGTSYTVPATSSPATIVPSTTVPSGTVPSATNGTTEPRPTLGPDYGASSQPQSVLRSIPSGTSGANGAADSNTNPGQSTGDESDPAANGASYFEAPRLYDPRDGRAQVPTVPVWTAVYHKPVGTAGDVTATSTANVQSSAPQRQAEIDAAGWNSAN